MYWEYCQTLVSLLYILNKKRHHLKNEEIHLIAFVIIDLCFTLKLITSSFRFVIKVGGINKPTLLASVKTFNLLGEAVFS